MTIRTYRNGQRTQVCTGPCGLTLPIDAFDRDGSKKSGYHTRCKQCRRVQKTEKPVKSPKVKPKVTAFTQTDEVTTKARKEAILDLIEAHRAEFETLFYYRRQAHQRKVS